MDTKIDTKLPLKHKKLVGKTFRWVVPKIDLLKTQNKQKFKEEILTRLNFSKTAKKQIEYYAISVETHQDESFHLDMLIIFKKMVSMSLTELDILCDKHGNLTKYRTLNLAILNYNYKEDVPLTNIQSLNEVLNRQEIKTDPYYFFQKQMLKDPFNFNLDSFCAKNDYYRFVTGYLPLATKLKRHQDAYCNSILELKSGIAKITPQLIKQELTNQQYALYHSWDGYQIIVDHLNQIPEFHYTRYLKTKNLLITGPSNIGKTSLIQAAYLPNGQHSLETYCAIYPMGMEGWFPKYKSCVYDVIFWNEMKLTSYRYDTILKLLEGSYVMLPDKGTCHKKMDNPLVIMTSNLTMDQHIKIKFGYNNHYYNTAKMALDCRVTNVIVPEGYSLFLLQKLLIPTDK